MKIYPLTTIEIGNSSSFYIKSVLLKTNRKSATIYESVTLLMNNIEVGNCKDIEIAGINSSALLVAIKQLSERNKKNVFVYMGSNFDEYIINSVIKGSKIHIKVFSAQTNTMITSCRIDFYYFKYLCNNYHRIVSELPHGIEAVKAVSL